MFCIQKQFKTKKNYKTHEKLFHKISVSFFKSYYLNFLKLKLKLSDVNLT